MERIAQIRAMIQGGETKKISGSVQEALDGGSTAEEILQAMIDAMGVIGEEFSKGEIFIPEMLIASKAMSKGIDVLKPLLISSGTSSLGTCIIGTIEGDLHDIGKNLVSIMIESAGFNIVDLGVDVPTSKWVEAVKENQNVTLVACSGLLTTTIPAMREAVKTLKESDLSGFKVIVGGAAVTERFADEIGADGYSEDAGDAAVKAVDLVKAI